MINVQEVEEDDVIENLLNPRAFTMLLDDETFHGSSYRERFTVFPRDYHPVIPSWCHFPISAKDIIIL